MFFPEPGGLAYESRVSKAKAVCARCLVRAACLDEALVRIPDGIAGGLTPDERRLLARGGAVVRPVEADEIAREARGRAEVAEAGSALLAAGRSIGAVARACGVSERPVYRWRARHAARAGAGRAAS